MNNYTPYQARIRECFAAAYRFLDEHKHARTEEDWERIVDGLTAYTDPLTTGLIAAVLSELEREYSTTI